jgi:apolipoprotein N-acyltransferase
MSMDRQPLNYAVLLLAGALLPLSLAPLSLWPVAIISIAVLFILLQNQSPQSAFKRAALFGAGLYLAGASWIYISMYVHGDVSMVFAMFGTLFFCLLLAVLFALPFALTALLPQSPIYWILSLPAIWVISEWFRSWIFTGFPWLYAGYSHTDTWLNGWAPLGGVLLLSYLTALGAAVLAQLLQRRFSPALGLSAALVVAAFFGGAKLQAINWTQAIDQQLSVALIQPNVDQKDKWAPLERNKILRQLLEQSEDHWGTDIIIWPEGAIPALYSEAKGFLQAVGERAEQQGTALITGIPTNNNPQGLYYNSMLVVGDGSGQYNKTRLVPFGEYVPFEALIRGLNNFFDLPMSSFSLGTDKQLPLLAKQQQIATAICYEIAYPDLVAKNTRNANVMLTVSNDAWFGDSIAPQQHMQMARMRAIENGKPLIRGTNNGITGLIDYRGAIYQQLDQFSRGVLSGTVTPRVGFTPYSRYTNWPIVGISLIIISLLLVARAIKHRTRKTN